jgi:hypothetical protein
MAGEMLDDGTILTDEAVNQIVEDVYDALDKGTYRVIPNPHKKTDPLKLSPRRQEELLKALSAEC